MLARTAAEIYFNPDDIDIYIIQRKDLKIWDLVMSRGPKRTHPFKLLITSNEKNTFTKEKIIETVESELRAVVEFGDNLFTSDEYGLLKAVTCKNFETKEEYIKKSAPVLEISDVERIIADLKNDTPGEGKNPNHSRVYEWPEWKDRYPA